MTGQPWTRLYPPHVTAEPKLPDTTVLAMFRERVGEDPGAPAIQYFGRDISRGELDELSDAAARGLARHGVTTGERVAVSLQNTPAFPIVLLAAWKLGAIVVPVNPMLRAKEMAHLLGDCTPAVLVCHPELREVLDEVGTTDRPHVVWSTPDDLAGDMPGPWQAQDGSTFGDLLGRADPGSADPGSADPDPGPANSGPGATDSGAADSVAADLGPGAHPTAAPAPQDTALLTYTSGTTGPSKGAMSTHANLVYQAVVSGEWFGLDAARGDKILTTAPFFHITGLGLHLAIALARGLPMVLTYRFEPATVLALLDRYRPSFTIGAITAFIALADRAEPGDAGLSAMRTSFSGGAPVAESVVERYERDFGVYIHNIYGLTESTSACIGVPLGSRAPLDEASGALSIGLPMPGVTVTVVDEEGRPAPAGTAGELVVQGPPVGSGYWQRPDETAHAFRPEGLHTGDIGVMDEDGWVFVVDRKKDLLVVSGYKVWPREVEDALYLHPAVREAAVVGRPDDYQGESVQAFVALRAGHDVTAEELQEHCRRNLSAYKCPRTIDFLDDLPKTATGKILRRELRES